MKNFVAGLFVIAFVGVLVVVVRMGGADWQEHDTLVFGAGDDAKSLDPTQISDGESVKVVVNVYETLLRVDFDGRLAPCLATRWDPLPDGKPGYAFTIREGVKFHDGTRLSPAIVVYSLDRLRNSNSGYKEFFTTISKIAVDSDGRVRIETSEPDATLLLNLAMFPACIVSQAAVEAAPDQFGLTRAVGTGPFRFVQWKRDQQILLERFADYWGEPAGVARVKFIQVRDNSQRFRLLKNGDLSYIDNFNPQDIEGVRSSSNLQYLIREAGQEISLLYLALNTAKPPFDNVKFRQAIAHALDKRQISRLYYGIARPAELPVPPGIVGHSNRVLGFPNDYERAKQLLEESGVTERRFKLMIMANARPYIRQPIEVARAIQGSLKKIGIELTVESYPWKQYLDDVQNGRHQLCLLGWTTDNGDTDNFLSTFYHSANTEKGSANNVAFYKDPRMDQQLLLARRTVDPARREQVLDELYRYAIDQSPLVPLVYVQDVIAFNRVLQNVRHHPLSHPFLSPIRIARAKETEQ